MYYYRYIRHFPLVATEVGVLSNYFADVIAATPNDVIEVEIKTSLEDFEHEFKSKDSKHSLYLNELINPGKKLQNTVYKMMPNRLFYAVENRLIRENIFIPIIFSVLGVIYYNFSYYVFTYFLSQEIPFLYFAKKVLLTEIIYTTILSVPVYKIFSKVFASPTISFNRKQR